MKKFLVFCLLSWNAHAGWVSAGNGEIFQDSHNPWFLKNVSQVNYCLKIAAGSVSASPEKVRSALQAAIKYWSGEFQKARNGPGAGQFVLGNQPFNEVGCESSTVNLSILVGYETLTQEQIDHMGEPKDYVGLAMRTDYNSDLVGSGFIFISSDQGATAYHGGTDPNLIPKAWSQDHLLQYAFMHELGHVFGLPHLGAGMMSETFLEQLLSPNLANAFSKAGFESFFAPDDDLDFCGIGSIGSAAIGFFGAPSGSTCIHLTYKGNRKWDVFSKVSEKNRVGSKLGTILAGIPDLTDITVRPAIVLRLNGNSTLFTPRETMYRPFMFGPQLVQFGLTGNFVPVKGAAKSVYIKQQPDTLQVQGQVNGKLQMLLNYFSPIGFLLVSNPTPP